MKRLDRLDIATSDLEDAATIYRRNFGLEVRRAPDATSATIAIGDAEIHLKSVATPAASVAPAAAEGLAALWLEAEDLDQVVRALKRAGIGSGPIRIEGGRRVLAIDPKSANQVPLFVFDRKL